jgi:hypothetical protein
LNDGVKDSLEEALSRGGGQAGGRHLSLEELEGLAGRRAKGEEVELPGHLTGCAVCLELYEVVLAGVPAVSEEALGRFEGIFEAQPVKARIGWRKWGAVAAGLVVCVGLAGVYMPSGRTSSVAAVAGLVKDGGESVGVGESIAGGQVLVAKEDTKAEFADGSGVVIEKGAKLAIEETNLGSKTVVLTEGRVEASVAKQTWGRKFEVSTPLGPVTVVGTKFSVVCGKEKVMVFERTGEQVSRRAGEEGKEGKESEITVVRVVVTEGLVRVSNRSEEVRVGAGQSAVMREREPRIEVGR